MSGTGIYRTRTIKRKPQEEKWNWENIRGGVFGLPWETSEENLKDNDEQLSVGEFTDESKRILEEEKKAKDIPKAPLRVMIRMADII